MTTFYTYHQSPVGPLLLTAQGDALTGLFMNEHRHGPPVEREWTRNDTAALFLQTRAQLDAYFAGVLTAFTVPLAPDGTDWQKCVWAALATIPYGTTATYGEIAARLGNPGAARAVGLANGRNPVSIIVPCHRVIGAGGKLTGYGGGLERKQALLTHEAAFAETAFPAPKGKGL